MPTTATTRNERVYAEIRRLCHAGLGPEELLRRAAERLGRAVPFTGYAVGAMDPLSSLPTSAFSTDIICSSEEARFFLEHIYFDDEVSEYGWMVRNRVPVIPLSEATDGRLDRALRHREFNAPIKGFRYELRAVFTDGSSPWGSMCLVRERGDPDFSPREVALIRRLTPHLGSALRAATLRTRAEAEPYGTPDATPPGAPDDALGVLVLDHRYHLVSHTAAAERRLHELDGLGLPGAEGWREGEGFPTVVWSAVMALKESLKGGEAIPQVCAYAGSGRWLTLQASLTESAPGRPSETVVVVAPAGPREVSKLRKSGYGLSRREEEICDLAVRGLSTREISRSLYISEYTVQDHLKNVFGKVGVKGRRELVKRLFLDNLPIEEPA